MIRKLLNLSLIFLLFIPIFIEGRVFFKENYLRDKNLEISDITTDVETSLSSINFPHIVRLNYSNLQNNIYSFNVIENNKKENAKDKPSVSGGKILGEILAGYLGGLLIGGACSQIGVNMANGDWEEESKGGVLGYLIGWLIGSALGVYLVGNTDDVTGSFGAALGGSFGGTLLFVIPAPIISTLVFNNSLRYKTPEIREEYVKTELSEKKKKEYNIDAKIYNPIASNSTVRLEVPHDDILSMKDLLERELLSKGFYIVSEEPSDYIMRYHYNYYSINRQKRFVGFTAYIINSKTNEIDVTANFIKKLKEKIVISDVIKELIDKLCSETQQK